MRPFDLPDLLYNMARSEMYAHYPALGFWNETKRAEFFEMLDKSRAHLEQMGLPVSRQMADQLRDMKRDGFMIEKLPVHMSAIRNVVVNEMRDHRFFDIPKTDVELYEKADLFGEKVKRAFPKAKKDIDAASRCLALGEGTACVFHLMRAMEIAVQKFGKKVAPFATHKTVSIDLYKDAWGDILKVLDPVIKHMPNSKPSESKRKEKFEAIYASLDHVKRAWRNKTARPRELEYKPAEARRVYAAVKGFMETLCGEI